MKRKIALLALLAVFAAIAASGTIAYFTSETHAHNVITSGGVGIKIVETMDHDGDPNTEVVPFPSKEYKEENPNSTYDLPPVMPGTSMSKIVQVKNLQNESWIRVWLNMDISEPGTPENNPTIKRLPLYITKDDGSVIDVVSFDLGNDWIKGDDNYYYYKYPVSTYKEDGQGNAIAGITTPLFEEVHFAAEMDNKYQNSIVNIRVDAEAVQYANNNDNGNVTVIDDVSDITKILGWSDGSAD